MNVEEIEEDQPTESNERKADDGVEGEEISHTQAVEEARRGWIKFTHEAEAKRQYGTGLCLQLHDNRMSHT